MRTFLKNSYLFFFSALLLAACQDETSLQSYDVPSGDNELSIPSVGEALHAGIGELIPLEEAATMTRHYQSANPDQPAAHFLGKSAVQQLLDLPGLIALRWVFGYTSSSKLTIIVEPLIKTPAGTVMADDANLIQLTIPQGYETPSPFYHGEKKEMAELSPEDGERISLEEAQSLVKAFREAFPLISPSFIQGRNVIEALMSTHSTPGLWVYVGQDKLNAQQVLVTPSNVGNENPSYPVADRSSICPPYCPNISQLVP